jgi:predicted glycoside hydrolase/deacetylase ChbG (UPF0249 family)
MNQATMSQAIMSQTSMRTLTLCADDFGQSTDINQGILALLSLKRLAAVSVMSQGPAWALGAPALKEHQQTADIGLHLNLTHRFDSDTYVRPLAAWLVSAPLGWVDRQAVRDTFRQQIDLFVKHLGRLPDYLDGHQHVHAFAVIREIVVEVIAEYWQAQAKPWVRAPDQLIDNGRVPFKAWVLRTATSGFTAHLDNAGLLYPAGFAGLYALTLAANFPERMAGWLRQLPTGTLIMVHPGERSSDISDISDPIRDARYAELQHLQSLQFADRLQSAGVRLARLSSAV